MLRRTTAAGQIAGAKSAELHAVLERVYDASFDRVYALAHAATGNAADAEDITAETYERAIRKVSTFSGPEERMVSWIYGIARNVVHEYHRDRDRKHEALPENEFEGAAVWPAEEAESAMEAERLLLLLPRAQREVLALRLAGLKLREIAVVLDKAEGTVKALQFAAVKQLRKVADE